VRFFLRVFSNQSYGGEIALESQQTYLERFELRAF